MNEILNKPGFYLRRIFLYIVAKKRKGRISILCQQENKARQIFENEHFLPPDTLRNFRFAKSLARFVFLLTPY